MAKIFISYRRAESAAISGRIYDRLVARFKRKNVFKDVDDIPAGVDFGAYIQQSVRECALMLVVIGPHWLDAEADDGSRRLDNPQDWVRVEIQTALKLGLTVIPLLVEGATMPTEHALPLSLRELSRLNALPVRNDPDFKHDMDRVIHAAEHAIATREPPPGILRRGGASRPIPKRSAPEHAKQPTQVAPQAQPAPALPAAETPSAVGSVATTSAPLKQSSVPRSPSKTRARGVVLAVMATILIVASIAVLFSQGIFPTFSAESNQQTTQTTRAHATPTATRSVTATPSTYQGKLPLVAAAPGYYCDQGDLNAFWVIPGDWPASFCQGTHTHLSVIPADDSSKFIDFDFYDEQANVRIRPPADFSISLQMNNLSANGKVSFTINGTTVSGTVRYTIYIDSHQWSGAGQLCPPSGSCDPYQVGPGVISNPVPHTLKFVFHGRTVIWYVDGITRGTHTESTLPTIDSVSMLLEGLNTQQTSVDFSDFTIAQG